MDNVINFQVHIAFDDEAKVWYIAKTDIPGLSLEADSATKLVERILVAAPELVELNQGISVDHVEAHVTEPRLPKVGATAKPRFNVLPIFDSPLELAFAT